jgi:hypothetical protein
MACYRPVVDFTIPDEKLLELWAVARRASEERMFVSFGQALGHSPASPGAFWRTVETSKRGRSPPLMLSRHNQPAPNEEPTK